MNRELIALYEIKRQSYLLGYIQNSAHFSSALAYAYYHRVSPIFHEGIARENYGGDPFEEIYFVGSNLALDVIRHIDDRWRENDLNSIQFGNIENRFGGYKENRMELVYLLGYARVSGKFEDAVWAAIEKRAPMEASPIDDKFGPDDVEFS